MTAFVHVDMPTGHPGVARAEALIDRIHAARRQLRGGRVWAVLLLAAILASLWVVADRAASASPEGELLFAWIVLCGVAFAGLALLAGAARSFGRRFVATMRQRREDRKMMDFARSDPRILHELQVIVSSQEAA
jgi:hypothetical protein